MSSINLSTLSGLAVQPTVYSGSWNISSDVTRTASGDYEFAPTAFTLDTNAINNNAASLLSTSTTTFAIQFPVSGIWSLSWQQRIGINSVPNNTSVTFSTYISNHTYNGRQILALGTPTNTSNRAAEQDSVWTNASGNTAGISMQNTATAVQEYKAGDIIAPSTFCALGNWLTQAAGCKFVVTLLKRTG